MKNIIDLVVITPEAAAGWRETVGKAVPMLRASGLDLDALPIEQAREEGDGSLTIFVTLPTGGELGMSIPREGWSWAN